MRKDQEKWEWFNYLYKKLYQKTQSIAYVASKSPTTSPAQPLERETPEKRLEVPKALKRQLGYWH